MQDFRHLIHFLQNDIDKQMSLIINLLQSNINETIIIEALLHVFITDFLLDSTTALTFFTNLTETNGPFFRDLAIFYFFLRSTINLFDAFFFFLVLNPLAGTPFLDLGCPPDDFPSPPPIG